MSLYKPGSRLIHEKAVFLILVLLVANAMPTSSISSSVPLTKATFDRITRNKTVLIKMFAPWCGHSIELAPHWERMAEEWSANNTQTVQTHSVDQVALIGEVDCTAEEEEAWCIELGVTGFPTLLYGDPSHGGMFLREYNGDKTYEALSAFANATLQNSFCSPGNIDPCSVQEQAQFKEYWNMSLSDLRARLERRREEIDLVHSDFDSKFQVMQKEYNVLAKKRELAVLEANRRLRVLKDELSARQRRDEKSV